MSESLDYQCACPAHVCDAIVDLRESYEYQSNCLKDSETDHKMHESIATGAVISHAAQLSLSSGSSGAGGLGPNFAEFARLAQGQANSIGVHRKPDGREGA